MQAKFSVAALALALGLTNVAHANDINTDLNTIGVPTNMSQVITHTVGTFTDKWIFDIAPPGLYSGGSVNNLQIKVFTTNLLNIDNLSVQLFDNSNILIDNLDDNVGSTTQVKVGSGVFPAGNDFYFKVTGDANGVIGGQYVFAVTTLPVPEPETYAMLLAGMGLLGATARRRM